MMPGTTLGAGKLAAAKAGCTIDQYDAHVAAGEKWCYACRSWHPTSAFAADRSRSDGLTATCRECRNASSRTRYIPTGSGKRYQRGRRYATARDGDTKQAQGRVNHLVHMGLLPRPNDLPCTDCGHLAKPGERHEYDHHLGYDAEHHEHVEPVCVPCHHRREIQRGKLDHIEHRDGSGRFAGARRG